MATVYRARDQRLDREVAVKVMHPHLRGADEARARFAREAKAVARLKHSAVLEIYDYSDSESEDAYIAAELLTGPTLKKFAEERTTIPAEVVAGLGIQLAQALEAAHAQGIVHRDVKPENVLLHEDRCIKLTDFGIAGMLDPSMSAMTATGQILGSPQHMAPEQVEGGDCDARTDLFALGTILYWLATGELPFSGKNPHQVLKRVVDCDPIDPLKRTPSMGAPLARVIRRCLQRQPEDRYADARALADALHQLLLEGGIDDVDEMLARYLADPEVVAEQLCAQTLERLLASAASAVERDDRPAALESLNRVLALQDGNEQALGLLDALGRASRRRTLLRAGAAAAVILATGASVWAFWPASPEAIVPEPTLTATATRTSPLAPDDGPEAPSEPTFEVTAPPPSETTTSADAPDAQTPVSESATPATRPRKPRIGKPRLRLGSKVPRTVVFKPTPMNVSISVDGGELRPFGPSFRKVKLPPGRHSFRFVGARDCCRDKVVEVRVRPGPGEQVLSPRLQFKPASLYVVSNVPADVTVADGLAKGRTRSVFQVPVERSLTERRRISVTAPGYRAYTGYVQLRAGHMASETVKLVPSDSSPPPTP